MTWKKQMENGDKNDLLPLSICSLSSHLSIPPAPEDICTNHTHHRAAAWLTCAVLLPISTLSLNREGDTYSRAGSGPFPSWGSKAYLSAYGVGNIL